MSYVIRNCPALRFKLFPLKENPICSKMPFEECCKDITDCVLKRIVELCKIETKPIQVYHATGDLPFVQTALNRKGADFAVKIIKLLEIEEVDEK